MRKTLIQSDPKLMGLHKKKLELHRQISERISGNGEMVKLIERALKIQEQLEKISKTQETKEVRVKEKRNSIKESDKTVTKPEPKKIEAVKDDAASKVIDKTSDAIIIEEEGLSYE